MPASKRSVRIEANPSSRPVGGAPPPVDAVERHRHDLDAARPRLAAHGVVVGADHVGDRMQSGGQGAQREQAASVPGRGRRQRVVAAAVFLTHPQQVPFEGTARHQVGHDALLQHRRVDGRGPAGPGHRVAQVGRHDHEAEAHRREHGLAEAADVDDAAIGIEALQARRRPRAVVEAAVVVVLEDPGAGPPRPGQQRQPPVVRHRHRQSETDAPA